MKKNDIEKENNDLRIRIEAFENELVQRDKIIDKLRLYNLGLRSSLRLLPILDDIKQKAKAFVSKATSRLHQLATNLMRHGPSRLIVNQDQANALVLELCRFLVLKSICQDDGTKLRPSPAIDAAWRAFLQLPSLYSQFCDELCGELLERHEYPIGNEENQSSLSSSTTCSFSSSLHTLILYGLIFDERAPASLWPASLEGTNKTTPTKVNEENHKKHAMESSTEGGSERKKKGALRELKN